MALITGATSFAQTTIWSEGFNDPACCADGTGIEGPGTVNIGGYPGSVSWTLDVSGASLTAADDYVKTNGGVLEVQDSDGPAIWNSGSIDISGCSAVQFSLDAIENGDMESADYVNVSYSIDGAAYTLIANWNSRGDATHTLIGDIPDDNDWISETVSVTGLSGSTLQLEVEFNCNAGAEQLSIDNVLVEGNCSCTPASEPTAASSGLTFENVGCNGLTIKWTSGNGSNRIVVMRSGSAVAGTPTDQTTYVPGDFGSGSTIAAGEYVVYKGSGDSCNVMGLSASTTYHVAVFDYNGNPCEENYYTTAPTGNQGTNACSTCPSMTSLIINACEGSCNEGDNELVFMDSGDYMFDVDPSNIQWFYESSSPASINFTESFTTDAAAISDMNTAAGCGTVFYDASVVGTIPPASKFIIASPGLCASAAYDFSAFCGEGPIFVLFTSDASWSSGGNFNNQASCSGGVRYIRADFSNVTGGCVTDYNWTCANVTETNGDYAVWSESGGAPLTYGDDDCAPSAAVLPIELLSFSAEAQEQTVKLSWITASELNNNYFTIERTLDGMQFEPIITVNASGNSSTEQHYTAIDHNPFTGTNYYRLKQTDFDGGYTYSDIRAVNINAEGGFGIGLLSTGNSSIAVHVQSETSGTVNLELFDALGKLLYSTAVYMESSTIVTIPAGELANGIYVVRVDNGALSDFRKFNY